MSNDNKEKDTKLEFNTVDCATCGIQFGILPVVERNWRKSEKTFNCPNGHSLVWTKPKETPEQKELKELRAKVIGLEEKLATALKECAEQKAKMEELQTELELWKPRDTDEVV